MEDGKRQIVFSQHRVGDENNAMNHKIQIELTNMQNEIKLNFIIIINF